MAEGRTEERGTAAGEDWPRTLQLDLEEEAVFDVRAEVDGWNIAGREREITGRAREGRRPKGPRKGMWPHQCSSWDDSYSVHHQGGSGVCYADVIAKQEQNISVFQKI